MANKTNALSAPAAAYIDALRSLEGFISSYAKALQLSKIAPDAAEALDDITPTLDAVRAHVGKHLAEYLAEEIREQSK